MSLAVVNKGGVPTQVVSNAKRWHAALDLSFEYNAEKTVLKRNHTGPLMVQRPFYPEGPVCHAYVLHPPGGVVGGDSLTINCIVAKNSSALITAPGANKFYGSDGRLAEFHQHIKMDNAELEWMPQESIFFDGCQVSQHLRIDLTQASRFIGWDITCFGRPAGNYHFNVGKVVNRLDVYIDKRPLLLERLRVNGASDLSRLSGLSGATCSATMLAVAPKLATLELLDRMREVLEKTSAAKTQFAATAIEDMLVIRYLGHSTEDARSGFITLWHLLRPIIMQRKAVTPRIWAT